MIRDNQRLFNKFHVVLDALVIGVSYAISYGLKFMVPWANRTILHLPADMYFVYLPFIVVGYLLLYYEFDLYNSKRASGRKREFFNLIRANTIGTITFIVALYLVKQVHISRWLIFYFFVINIILSTIERNVVRQILRLIRKRGFNRHFILLIGYSKAAENYIDKIIQNPQWGYVIRGILDDKVDRGTMYRGVKVLGSIGNLEYILPENKLDEIAITLSLSEYGKLESIVNLCEKSGVHTQFIPDYYQVIPSKPYMEDIDGLAVINIRHVPLTNTLNMLAKRIVDIIGSVVLIILFSPIMVIAAIAIKLTSPGPIIFAQERVGLHNRPFKMYKFRSMEMQKPSVEAKGWTRPNDPRVTGIGKILRRTSMDELPQFFNILRGDMSIVGPRPERPQFVEKFKEEIPRYMIKHQVRPGLTGWAQVNGLRGDTSIRKRVEYDLFYIENWTITFDIKIMFMTVFKGLINKNAY
ncbi:Undecaprenyl-phosphate glucose phosphotransferase [Lachnospiraceae bacterium KH1T2]|nr:Undecaprenyl-phosphate glucose phosphotransferase [Lachnospiraceae bacterium KH1T2]